MEMESRRREIARRKRRRQRQLRRRLAGGAAGIAAGLAAFVCVGSFWGGREASEPGVNGSVNRSEREALVLNVGNVEQEATGGILDRFDLREVCDAITVPDQGAFNTCWAFASLKALETTRKDGMALSADHMSLHNSFGLGQDAGGDYSMASAYLLAWQGPVAEGGDPYGDAWSPEGAEPVCHVQEIQIMGKKDPESLKRAVCENGGVQSACYIPQTAGAERETYYREETCSYYYHGTEEPNHDVVIVGWDDHYPRENFVQQPETDGAFLCMNTWGTEFGESGYFYVSYEDRWIGETCVAYTGVETVENYDRNYQTDLCGWTGQIGYGAPKAWFANVYEADWELEVAAVGFYSTAPETTYRVYVEPLMDDELVPGTKASAEGRFGNVGYYTVPLVERLAVESGSRFAVIVEIDSPGTTEPVAMEYVADSRMSKVDIGDGEGYISFDGVNWERTETEYACNVCLKVYADER